MTKVHVVNHTHWDREWYFTTADAFVLSENSFTEMLDELERNPKAKFCLDGQTSILDDYVQIRPERVEQIKKFVAEKRLEIGPWYTQTDAFFVNEESIIRNLMVGIRDTKKYGEHMKIGYLPDTFGFNAQLPTIFQNCGIDNIIFYRGINYDKHVKYPYFMWKALNDKKIYAVNLLDGYGSAQKLNVSEEYINGRLIPKTEYMAKAAGKYDVLLTAGEDQQDIIKDLSDRLASVSEKTGHEYIQSTYEEFMDYIRTLDDLEIYQGEFREPCIARVHKTIGSVRYDIKRMNFIIEQKLLNRVEPLMAIAKANGINISEKMLHVAWKKIMEGQAHDGMGGCVSDSVTVDILHRIKEAMEMADSIENIITKRLAEQMRLKDNQIIVFNTSPKAYKGYKIIEFMCPSKNIEIKGHENAVLVDEVYYAGKDNVMIYDGMGRTYINEDPYYKLKLLVDIEIPSMGYKVVEFSEVGTPLSEVETVQETTISNEFYTINSIGNNLELTTSFGKTFTNFLEFEDCGNDGDTYDFSPLRGDVAEVLSLNAKDVKTSKLFEEMTLEGSFEMPLTLEDRVKDNGETGALDIELKLRLVKGSKLIECECKVNNQIYSHRLRVKVNAEIATKETIASLPFGFIRRPVLNGEPTGWEEKFVEMPIDIEPYDASVSVDSAKYTVSAFGKGIKEYQHIGDSMYLTLFASTGDLGKPNLLYRPGRASGDTTKKGHEMMPTPMAELIGGLEFEFSFSVLEGSFDEYEVSKLWEDYTKQDISYQLQELNKFVHRLDNKIQLRENPISSPKEFSLLSISDEDIFSSLVPSLYDESAFVLRLKNPTGKARMASEMDLSKFSKVEKVNYIEEVCENQNFEILAYDTLTLKLWM